LTLKLEQLIFVNIGSSMCPSISFLASTICDQNSPVGHLVGFHEDQLCYGPCSISDFGKIGRCSFDGAATTQPIPPTLRNRANPKPVGPAAL
jgi:hypothetical protein